MKARHREGIDSGDLVVCITHAVEEEFFELLRETDDDVQVRFKTVEGFPVLWGQPAFEILTIVDVSAEQRAQYNGKCPNGH